MLTWRQEDSLEQAQQLYPRVTNILLPDAAFMIGPLQESSVWSLPGQQRDLLLLLRNDMVGNTNTAQLVLAWSASGVDFVCGRSPGLTARQGTGTPTK